MKLQALIFCREPPASGIKADTKWEWGFAKVENFGESSVKWIIDEDGNKVETVHDYHLRSSKPGHMAEL